MPSASTVLLFTATFAAATATSAQEAIPTMETRVEEIRNYVNMRGGATTGSSNRRPELCLEVSPIALLSVEACGTGSGFLHTDPEPEIAHFRAKATFFSKRLSFGVIDARGGLGFAELQIGEDGPGFDFGGTGPNRTETAGPEAGVFLRAMLPVAVGIELVAELSLGAAYFAHAPNLIQPMRPLQALAALNVGIGF